VDKYLKIAFKVGSSYVMGTPFLMNDATLPASNCFETSTFEPKQNLFNVVVLINSILLLF